MSEWEEVALGELVDLFDHKRVPLSSKQRSERPGPYPYYGAQGVIDHINDFILDGRFILIPEDGENLRSRKLPIAYFAEGQFWVNNHAHIVKAKPGVAVDRFVQGALEATDIGPFVTGAAQPKLSQANLRQIPLRVPPLGHQITIASILDALDDLIENSWRRVEVLEEIARAVYREWFVRFRYPGHEDVSLVDSALGPIPEGWAVKRVADLGTTGAGPFGSKLGRKDYVADGVPVLRGTNLRVGGGFDESDFVFVTPQKAEELRSSTTLRGDVVITQRGTLGQIALIPETSSYERYVLSQSQMKLTVNTDAASAEFVYRQMSTAEVTARFIAQAMSSGVPHVNLTLLREFEILAPPNDLQHRFGDVVRGIDQEASALRAQARTLGALRDLLLPKLVTGQIDLSHLDLDELTEAATA